MLQELPLHYLERYPELLFKLQYGEVDFKPSPQSKKKRVNPFLSRLDLQETEIVYLYGLGEGEYSSIFFSWLREKKERRLVILEEKLNAIAHFLQSVHAEGLLFDHQVVLQLLPDPVEEDLFVQELVSAYPTERIEVVSSSFLQPKEKRRFQQIKMKLLRSSASAHALMAEVLYSHRLLPNLIRNIYKWPHSFSAIGLKGKFRGVPAIICGAGPSLTRDFNVLKTLEDKALLIAGGSAISALSNHGIIPHLGMALDPNPEELERLRVASAYEMPLIYATRLQPDVWSLFNGPAGYLHSDTGGPCESYFEKEMGIKENPIGPELGIEAFSVTTLAIAFALEMGCDPIFLHGVDLSYPEMARYAEGVISSPRINVSEMLKNRRAAERALKRKNQEGHYVYTLMKWVMESDCISAYAKLHTGRQFYNFSTKGLKCQGIPHLSLEEGIGKYLLKSWDLRAQVHAYIHTFPLGVSEEKLSQEIDVLRKSLFRLALIADEILAELQKVREDSFQEFPTGRITILEIDFQEEKGFECLFPLLGPVLNRLLDRLFYCSQHCSEEEVRKVEIDRQIAKWTQWKEMIAYKKEILQTL